MPQLIPAAAAAFAAIKGAVAVISAVKVLGITLATWGKIAMWTAMGASMLMKPPGLPSAGVQVNLQPAGPNAPLPIIFGRTGVQGFITYREAYPDAVHNSSKNNKLCFESVVSVGPIKSISNYTLTGHAIGWDRDPTRPGSSSGVSICRSVAGFDPKSSVWKDGVRAAFILGEHNDNRTLRTITGDAYLPKISAIHGMAGLARIVNVYELDGSKNLRFPAGFPDDIQAVVEGVYTYDPRKDSTFPGGIGPQRIDQPLTWGWSENPYIIALAYALGATGPTGHKMWGIGADEEDVDIPAFVHGANVADANGWKIGGMVTTDDNKDAVLSNLLVGGAGQYLPGPQISVFVNEPKVSTFTLKQTMLVGDQVIRATRPMKDRFNRILVKYREPNSNYEIITGQEVSDAGYVALDGGLRTTETTYPLIQQATQAHQIAAYELVNGREYEVDVTTTAEALAVERGDMITLDFPIAGIESQNFIVKNWSFDAASQTVAMTLVSETPGKHDFALGRTATAPAPAQLRSYAALNPSAPDPTDWTLVANQIIQQPPAPVELEEGEEPPPVYEPVTTPAFVFEGEATEPSISAIVVEMREFDQHRADRIAGETDEAYEARQDAGWSVAFEAAPNSTRLIVSEVSPSSTYDIAIRYRSNLGVTSPRLVYGGRATGNLSFDFNDPTVIINVPPILRDLAGLAELERLANAAITDGLENLGNAVTDLEGRVTDLDGLLDTTAGTVANAVSRLDGVWAVVGENDGSGLRRTVLELVENATGDTSEIVTRVTGLEQIVNGTGGQALARITDLDELETSLDGTYAKASTVSGLQSQVTNHGTTISGLSTRMTTAETDIAGKASVSDLTNLGSRVTTAEGDITATNTRLDTVETDVAGKASATSVGNLQSEINGARNGSANLGAQLSTMRQTTTDGLAGKASVSDLTNLTGRVGTAENTITGHAGRLTTVESDVAGRATTSQVNTLSNEIVAARNGGTNLKSRIDGLQTTLTDAINLRATSQSVLDLQSEITNARGGQGSLSARFTQVNNSIVDGLAGKASAQSVSDLSASVGGFDARITSAANVAAQANGRASAIQGVVLDVNGLISGYSSVNNGTTSAFNVNANTFNLLTPGNPGDRIELTGTSGLKMFKNGVRRIMIGFA
ncbi:phage tail protein [Brevundimonas sp. TWP1-2-1b1]|uniref:phage tail protein n=1 Tax=unclassified Brevundimonas TaxID=2622653 RepID=UPI003CEEF8BF